MSSNRTGRLSLRMTPDFIDLCTKTAKARGQTLTEFTQQAMAMNLTRTVDAVQERKAQIIQSVLNHG